jgi:hypothetical protein
MFQVAFEADALIGHLNDILGRLDNLSGGFTELEAVVRNTVISNLKAGGRPKWPQTQRGRAPRVSAAMIREVSGMNTVASARQAIYAFSLSRKSYAFHSGVERMVQRAAYVRTQTKAFGKEIAPVTVNVKAHSYRLHIPPRPYVHFLGNRIETDLAASIMGRWIFGKGMS